MGDLDMLTTLNTSPIR